MPLYKYLEQCWAEAFVNEGEVLFRSLTWFQQRENDPARGDEFEGVRRYFPANGLQITKITEPSFSFVDPNRMFRSAARYRDHIFILCTSKDRSASLASAFAEPGQPLAACVEIFDSERFYVRLSQALQKRSPVQQRTLFRADISYYSFKDPPEGVWALPDKLATYKERVARFVSQDEHRFLFSTKPHAFKVHKVDLLLADKNWREGNRVLDSTHSTLVVLGPLHDCCRIVPV